MPYIKQASRDELDRGCAPVQSGDLCFLIYRAMLDYADRKGFCYTTAAEAVAACETAKLEFVRRKLAPYEDKKIAENGDVLPSSETVTIRR